MTLHRIPKVYVMLRVNTFISLYYWISGLQPSNWAIIYFKRSDVFYCLKTAFFS